MNFSVRCIGGEYSEMKVDEIETGTLDAGEAVKLAKDMVSAAQDLLFYAGYESARSSCFTVLEILED